MKFRQVALLIAIASLVAPSAVLAAEPPTVDVEPEVEWPGGPSPEPEPTIQDVPAGSSREGGLGAAPAGVGLIVKGPGEGELRPGIPPGGVEADRGHHLGDRPERLELAGRFRSGGMSHFFTRPERTERPERVDLQSN